MKRSLLTIICFLLIRQEEVAVVAAASDALVVVVVVVAAFWRGQNNNDDDDNNDFNERPFPFSVQLKSIIYFVPSRNAAAFFEIRSGYRGRASFN